MIPGKQELLENKLIASHLQFVPPVLTASIPTRNAPTRTCIITTHQKNYINTTSKKETSVLDGLGAINTQKQSELMGLRQSLISHPNLIEESIPEYDPTDGKYAIKTSTIGNNSKSVTQSTPSLLKKLVNSSYTENYNIYKQPSIFNNRKTLKRKEDHPHPEKHVRGGGFSLNKNSAVKDEVILKMPRKVSSIFGDVYDRKSPKIGSDVYKAAPRAKESADVLVARREVAKFDYEKDLNLENKLPDCPENVYRKNPTVKYPPLKGNWGNKKSKHLGKSMEENSLIKYQEFNDLDKKSVNDKSKTKYENKKSIEQYNEGYTNNKRWVPAKIKNKQIMKTSRVMANANQNLLMEHNRYHTDEANDADKEFQNEDAIDLLLCINSSGLQSEHNHHSHEKSVTKIFCKKIEICSKNQQQNLEKIRKFEKSKSRKNSQ